MADDSAPDWDRFAADFPVNKHLIWLNNCGTTPLGDPIRARVNLWLEEYGRRGTSAEGFSYPGIKDSIHRKLEALLNAIPGELALIHHTSEGMNFISHGVALRPGDEILILENEYPSNVYPWEHWRAKGVLLRTVPLKANPEEFLAAFEAMAGPKVRLVSLSAVHWCTGMPLPLEAIGRVCAQRNITFVVDGSQGVGLVDLDVRAAGIQYMAFSAWKWLLGPVGQGVLFIAGDRLESLKPIFKGTESVEGDYLPYKENWKPSADRFAISTGSFTDWVYLEASLAYLEGIGFTRVRARIRSLATRLSDGLRGLGFRIAADAWGGGVGIVVVFREGMDAGAMVRALKARNIIAAERLGGIRFAPHIYNTEAQIDTVIGAMRSLGNLVP